MAATILLVRHGETDWNRERRWQGHADRPLTEEGREQARALADALADVPVAAVYSSDLLRAYETARTIADRKALEIVALPELREVDVGSWSGLTHEEIRHRFPGAGRRDWEGGESYDEMAARVLAALRRIAERHAGEHVVVVTHGGPVRAAMRHCGHPGRDEPLGNCAVIRVAVENGAFRAVD